MIDLTCAATRGFRHLAVGWHAGLPAAAARRAAGGRGRLGREVLAPAQAPALKGTVAGRRAHTAPSPLLRGADDLRRLPEVRRGLYLPLPGGGAARRLEEGASEGLRLHPITGTDPDEGTQAISVDSSHPLGATDIPIPRFSFPPAAAGEGMRLGRGECDTSGAGRRCG